MITILDLHLKNFMGVKKADFDFSQHDTILITGENGQGKTSILRAIALCLSENKQANKFSEYVAAGEKKASIQMNVRVGEELLSFDINLNNEESGGQMLRNVMYKGTEYINSEVTPLLEELELKYFSDIILSMQGAGDVTQMTPVQLGKYIQKLLDFEFSSQIKTLDEEIKDHESLSKDYFTEISYKENEITTRETEIQTLLELPEIDVELENEKLNKLNTELRKISTSLNNKSNLEKSLLDTTNSLHELETKKLRIDNAKKILNEKKDKVEQQKIEKINLERILVEKRGEFKKTYLKRKSIDEQFSNINNSIQELRLKKDELQDSKNKQIKLDSEKKLINTLKTQNIEKEEKIKTITQNIELEEANKITISQKINNLNSSIIDIENNIKILRQESVVASNTLSMVKHKFELFQKGKCPECGQDLHNAFKADDINVELFKQEYDTIENKIDLLEKELIQTRSDKESNNITSLDEKISNFKKQINLLESEIELNTKEISNYKLGDIINLADLEKDIEKINIDLKSFEKDLEDINTQKDSLSKLASSIEGDISNIEEKINILKIDIESINSLETIQEEVSDIDIENLKNKIKEIEKEIKDIGTIPDIASINLKIEEINSKLQELENVKKDNKKIVENNNRITEIINSLIKAIEVIKTKNVELQNNIKLKKDAKTIFEKSLPNYLIIKTCASLQTKINTFVKSIFPNITVELNQSKNGLNFTYYKDGKGPINAKLTSGFESQVLSVGFRVALCQSYDLGFMILDECDSMGSEEKSSNLFENILALNTFNQLFVISHKTTIREILEASSNNLITYSVENGNFVED